MAHIFFLISIIVAFSVNAQNIEIPVGPEYKSIHFRINNHDVKFQESTNGKVSIVGINDRSLWNFKKDAEGALVIEPKDYESQLFSGTPEVSKNRLQIKVPILPLLVVGNELELGFESIKNSIKVVLIKGGIKGFKTQGDLRAFVNSGEVNLDFHSGPFFLDGSQVKVSVKNSSGDLRIKNYTGSVALDKNTGHSAIFNYQGSVSLISVSGSSQIEISKGSVQIAQSQGRHEIQSDDANLDLKATKESDFNVKMNNGKLNYQSQGVTGSWLNLSTKEGDLYLPTGLKPQRIKTEVFFKGRTPGEKTASRLEVKSVNAPIIVK